MTDHDKSREKIPGGPSGGRGGGGDSAGGAYPNPHTGKSGSKDGYMGHGGQSEQPYHGGDQLGGENFGSGENVNSATRDTGKGEDEPTD